MVYAVLRSIASVAASFCPLSWVGELCGATMVAKLEAEWETGDVRDVGVEDGWEMGDVRVGDGWEMGDVRVEDGWEMGDVGVGDGWEMGDVRVGDGWETGVGG